MAAVAVENITEDREFKKIERPRIEFKRLPLDLAEKIDSLFNVKNCLIEVNPGNVLMTPKYEDLGERILDMKIRPDDVWMVSYPRTGSTWAQEMVWCIGNDLDFEKAKILAQLRTPIVEFTSIVGNEKGELKNIFGDSVEQVNNMPSPRYIKSHLPMGLLPLGINTVKPKLVYIARNPKDMCVSYYHYCKLIHDFSGSFDDFCELFISGRAPIGPIWSHILGFWRLRNEPNVLFLTYEYMKRDQEGAIRRTADFLGKTLSDKDVERLAEHLSFGKMKKNASVNCEGFIACKNGPEFLETTDLRTIRKGEVGDWKNFMSPEMVSRFDRWTEDNLRGTGLSFN